MGIWTPCLGPAARIEAAGNRLLACIIRPHVAHIHDRKDISIARHKIISVWRCKLELGLLNLWALTLARWIHHVYRHTSSPPYLILHSQTSDWLRHARALSGRMSSLSVHAGGTRTRGETGKVVRWAGKWLEAISSDAPLVNTLIDPGLTREPSNILLTLFEHGRWHGERVLEA